MEISKYLPKKNVVPKKKPIQAPISEELYERVRQEMQEHEPKLTWETLMTGLCTAWLDERAAQKKKNK